MPGWPARCSAAPGAPPTGPWAVALQAGHWRHR
ncbi:hypothetical protein HBN81_02225 [Pseudomonas fragi]|uniref:Uncharacterized protein n=2 Tax=Pseudomonas TaxID=286 RepID=A0A9Q5FSY3_PSEFR|nr:hypothetical protein [Pseudomonas fragi]NNA85190.1 hypothetical protein [Pseudomonas fragi]NNB09192.1 hypothetical protein [Pseudomonas fragi]NNB27678.1 hypothetical protein [Pseudomonas fragi]NNB29273.1 hypothetical protein [Pseudomonas fragi]